MQPKTEPRWLSFVFFGPSSVPRLASSNARPRHRQYLIHTTPPPASIALHSRFTRCIRNRAVVLGFVFFWPPAHSPASYLQTHSPTTTSSLPAPHHHLPPSSSAIVSHGAFETELSCSFRGFRPLVPLLPRVCERNTPPPPPPHLHHTTISPHHNPPPFRTAHPKPSYRAHFCAFQPSAPLPPRICKHNAPWPLSSQISIRPAQ